jgi:hypothetical protein
VLLVVSEIKMAMMEDRIVMAIRLEPSESPMTLARPVDSSSEPSAMPPPNSRIVPQSICTASRQLSVNCRLPQSIGRTNKSPAAMMATTPSL